MAREVWVGPNRRALGLGMLLPALVMTVGVGLCWGFSSGSNWPIAIAALLMLLGAIPLVILIREWFRPRVAYRSGQVEFYLRPGAPFAVPVETVEAFFLGQSSSLLPARINPEGETVTLVARLARRATEWSHREVKPSLGRWCDGYVTLRGTWCEPLTVQLVRELNRRLYELKRDYRAGDGWRDAL